MDGMESAFESLDSYSHETVSPWEYPSRIAWDVEGLVLDIDHFSVHDGPGLRTTVFLKGCPLSCIWCHSPESISPKPQLFFHRARCVHCGVCVAVCPRGAQHINEGGDHRIDWASCDHCGLCTYSCVPGALVMAGKQLSVSQVVEKLRPYFVFFQYSGGGVTISGGEATAQPRFTLNLLKALKEQAVHTAIETCGFARWEVLMTLCSWVNLVLYDLKQMDTESHRRYTGVGNELILENLARLVSQGKEVQIRLPLIPGYNDSEENIRRTVEYAARIGVKRIAFLPYNPAAVSKYCSIGENFSLEVVAPPKEQLESFAALASSAGLDAFIGS